MKFCKICYAENGTLNSAVVENPHAARTRHEYLCRACHERGTWTAATCRTFREYEELSSLERIDTSGSSTNA